VSEELVRGIYERWAEGDFTVTLGVIDEHTVFVRLENFRERADALAALGLGE
jgi:hypothetical protein